MDYTTSILGSVFQVGAANSKQISYQIRSSDKRKYKNIFTLHLFRFYKNVSTDLLNFFLFCFGSAFYSPIMFFFSFVMHYVAILNLQISNFIIFQNEKNRSESEEPKRKSIGIAYSELKPFRSKYGRHACIFQKFSIGFRSEYSLLH